MPIKFTAFGEESDPGPYPIPPNAPVEGAGEAGDRHVLVLQEGSCKLYELYNAQRARRGLGSGIGGGFNLRQQRAAPNGWTSADAAGLPIMQLLVRYDEVHAGRIDHALRMTVERTQEGFIHPATHYASNSTDSALPPESGLRLRLKGSFNLSPYHGQALVVLRALKRYGLIVADNGSNWYITGAPDRRWNDEDLDQLKRVPGSAFRRCGLVRSCDASRLRVGLHDGRRLRLYRHWGQGLRHRGLGHRRLRLRGLLLRRLLRSGLLWGTECCGGLIGLPRDESLNSRMPLPSERPISGRRRAPNTSSRITTRNAIWSGLSSPINFSLTRYWLSVVLLKRISYKLGRHEQDQQCETHPQSLAGELVGERHSPCCAHDRKQPQQQAVGAAHVAVAILVIGAHKCHGNDRQQRGGLGLC